MKSPSTLAAALFGLTGVVLAALESHVLAGMVEPGRLPGLRWAILLQLVHAVALLAVGDSGSRPWTNLVIGTWIAGVVLFSGSVYLLVLIGWSWLGPVTPIGGLLLLLGWGVLFLSCLFE